MTQKQKAEVRILYQDRISPFWLALLRLTLPVTLKKMLSQADFRDEPCSLLNLTTGNLYHFQRLHRQELKPGSIVSSGDDNFKKLLENLLGPPKRKRGMRTGTQRSSNRSGKKQV